MKTFLLLSAFCVTSVSFCQNGYKLKTESNKSIPSIESVPLERKNQINEIKFELEKLELLLKQKPDDKDLQDKLKKLKTKLENAEKTKTAFSTDEWVDLDYRSNINIKRNDSIIKLEQKLKDDNETMKLTVSERNRYKQIKDSIESCVLIEEEIIDSLHEIYMCDYIRQTNSIIGFGPKRSRAFFDLMYSQDNDWTIAQTSGLLLNFGTKSGSIYTEIVNGNLGLFRIGFGVMVSQNGESDSTESKVNDAYQRLISNGGNTALKLEYPLFFFHSSGFQYNFVGKFNGTLAADIPSFGTNTADFAGNLSYGLELYADASTKYKKKNEKKTPIRLFASCTINGYSGTKEFQENLGLKHSNFGYGQVSFGFLINQTLKISFIVGSFSSERALVNKGVIAGGQVLPTY